MKYFHYISKAEVDMLLALTQWSILSSFSVTPKGAKVKGEVNKGLVGDDMQRLLRYLKKLDTIVELEDQLVLDSGSFYHSEMEWHHGVFYFATMRSVAVTYLLWTTQEHSLILLAGSPANIIGQSTHKQGVILSNTGDGASWLGSCCFLNELREDGENHFSSSSDLHAASAFGATQFTHIDWIYLLHVESRAAPLAMFCFRYLSKLPMAKIDTAFRIYSTFRSPTGDCLMDLQWEQALQLRETAEDDPLAPKLQRGPDYKQCVQEELAHQMGDAERFHLERYRVVYLGTPVYTALA